MGVDEVMIVQVTPGGRLGMCMHGYSEVTVDLHVRGQYRGVDGDVAPMCIQCVSVSVGRTVGAHIMDSMWLGG